jgi:hypothetical protein
MTADIIPFPVSMSSAPEITDKDPDAADISAESKMKHVVCSFCGRDVAEVFCMVAGPTVFICDGCIAGATEIVAENRARKNSGVPF